MKKLVMVLVLGWLVLGCAGAQIASDSHGVLGTALAPARGWRVEEGHLGETVMIPALGKVTVVDFWSSSCGPCLRALPDLERLWGRVDCAQVAIIGVSIDEDDSQTRRTLHEALTAPVSFPMVFDGKAARLQSALRVAGRVPSTFVLDRQGRVRAYFDGSTDDLARLERAVAELIKEQ